MVSALRRGPLIGETAQKTGTTRNRRFAGAPAPWRSGGRAGAGGLRAAPLRVYGSVKVPQSSEMFWMEIMPL